MLEQIDLSKKMNEKEYNETVSHLEIRLAQLQRKCREQNIPVMIFMEGLEAGRKRNDDQPAVPGGPWIQRLSYLPWEMRKKQIKNIRIFTVF